MNKTNYHSHTVYCDGRAYMDDFLRFAQAEGYTSYGFSSHAPLPFPTAWTMEWDRMDDYLAEAQSMKAKYAGRVEVYVGLEIDYIDKSHNASLPCFRHLPLDYRIGSVHMLKDDLGRMVDIDCPPALFRRIVDVHFGSDVEQVVRRYYMQLDRMLDAGGFDIVGHADKMHYNAMCMRPGLLDEPWYDRLVRDYFAKIVACGYQIEVNTKAWNEQGVFFPNQRYFPYLFNIGATVQVNSDAHYPDRIGNGREEALRQLWQAGFRCVSELHDGRWQMAEIAR